MREKNEYFKALSLLLQYPDEQFFSILPEVKSFVGRMAFGPQRRSIEAFLEELESRSVLQLQTQYTALFDISPSTTLNMTYHLWGDSEKRSRLLISLQQEYSRAGFVKKTPELPDFLPMILEFMALVSVEKRSAAIQKCFEGIEKLVERLKLEAAPYAKLLEPLAGMFPKQPEKEAGGGGQ